MSLVDVKVHACETRKIIPPPFQAQLDQRTQEDGHSQCEANHRGDKGCTRIRREAQLDIIEKAKMCPVTSSRERPKYKATPREKREYVTTDIIRFLTTIGKSLFPLLMR